MQVHLLLAHILGKLTAKPGQTPSYRHRTGTLPRSIHALISSSIICLHFTAYCTVPCCRPCHVHCGGRGCYQHQLPQCQWQAAQLCQPHFTSDCWYIFSRSQGRFGTFFSKSFDQLLEADGEDTNLVFSPTPSLLGDHCMRVLHLAEPNFAWGQQPKPHGYSPVGQKEMMVTGVFENKIPSEMEVALLP